MNFVNLIFVANFITLIICQQVHVPEKNGVTIEHVCEGAKVFCNGHETGSGQNTRRGFVIQCWKKTGKKEPIDGCEYENSGLPEVHKCKAYKNNARGIYKNLEGDLGGKFCNNYAASLNTNTFVCPASGTPGKKCKAVFTFQNKAKIQ